MKHITFLIKQKKEYKEAQKEAQKTSYNSVLIQVFTGLTDKSKIKNYLKNLTQDFPNAIIIGTTTAGEISHASMHENETVVSLSLFKRTKLKVHYTPNIDENSGKILSRDICSKQTKAAIVLSEGLKGLDYEAFIRGIKKENPQVIIAGGLAGDNFALKKTYIFYGKKVYKEGAIAISFSGKKLLAQNRYNLNWTPIGKEFTITASEGNLIKQIDNEDAVDIFKRYLGQEVFNNNAAALPDFQMLYREGKTVVSRTPMMVDGKHLIFAGPLAQGQKVQFGFSNASSVISGSNLLSHQLSKNPAEAIYIYSCIARKTLLGKVLEDEFKPFESIAPTAGFFTYGEFYSTNQDNALLNCTTTILVLSENTKQTKQKIHAANTNSDSLDNSTFKALTHFIKQTSDELKINIQLLQEYKDVVDKSSLVSKTDKNGVIIYANDNFCNTSQFQREELLGSKHNIIRDPNMSDFIFKKLWSSILNGKVWKGILSNRAKDGTIYFVDTTIMPIVNNKHEIIEFIAIRQDITKQIEAKKRIQEKEKLIKAIFDNQDSIVLLSSKKEGMLSANKKLFHYLDYNSFEEFKNEHDCICNLFMEEDGYIYPSKYPNWIDDTAHDKSDADKKAKILTKDGVIRTFNIMVKQIDDKYIINLYDITNLEHAIIKAHASERAKSVFLANMSHEIRTPLNGILGFTDVLLNKDLDADAKRFTNIIHQSGQTLLSVVNDILDFSKLESGEFSLYEDDANLFMQMESTVATFASVAKKKHLDYHVFIDSNIPKILLCDIQRIKQVINNLISNAIKFTPEDGHVQISITLKELVDTHARILFSVKDSGIGIAKEKISTVFQAFSQADNSISREYGGTGLGLSISNQYIHMMGAQIDLQSEEGKGSEFYFTLELPVVDAAKAISTDTQEVEYSIVVLESTHKFSCAINDIVYTYLETWNMKYRTIKSVQELQESDKILIVCAQLFDNQTCLKALNSFKDLHLVYIEGAQDIFSCQHQKFHLLEQPMTGSLLFDKIISLHDIKQLVIQQQVQKKDSKSYKGNILVAEDNQTNQILIGLLLEERNLDYTIVENGQKAVKEANNAHYDIIFMDINMPVMDGVTAIKILREDNYTRTIISLSANVIESDRKSFIEAGVDDTLNKPLVPAELDSVLQKYLSSKSEQVEEEKFDTLDLDKLATTLGIQDTQIILKLLGSFTSSLTKIAQEIENDGLNTDTLHNLKGLSGNLRFNKLYALTQKYETKFNDLGIKALQKAEILLLKHINFLITKINDIKTSSK